MTRNFPEELNFQQLRPQTLKSLQDSLPFTTESQLPYRKILQEIMILLFFPYIIKK
jgi:hypothetical protein